MADIVIMGAGLSGAIMAYEMKDQMRREDRLTVVTKDPLYHFVPSNPWVPVGWRTRELIQVDLARTFAKRGIGFKPSAVAKASPKENTVETADGSSIRYDYLIIATGPELAFDEVEGPGPDGFTNSICHIDHAEKAADSFEAFCKNPGPVVIGAAQGASCFGPAYEFMFILETELRRRKIRDKVPMTFVTAVPYIGHLGLDGVGDTKGLLESEMRDHHIKWITSARIKKVEQGKMTVEEVGDDGTVKATRELPFGFSMILPAFRGIAPLRGVEGLVNPRGFVIVDKHQQNPTFRNIFSVGVCVAIKPVGPTPVPCGVPKTGFMDRIDGDGDRSKPRADPAGRQAQVPGYLERGVPRRLRQFGHRLRRPAPDSAAQRQLVLFGEVGSRCQVRLREILPAQDAQGRKRAFLRVSGSQPARNREAQGR